MKPIYISGDSHGHFDVLFDRIDQYGIEDAIFISVGDNGIGFTTPKKQERQFELLNNRFKKRNIECLCVRGNHDDPFYFKGSDRVVLSNMELLEDYTYKIINGQKFLFVGGALSIDRTIRREGTSYWPDEVFVLDEHKIEECDVLITHSTPSWNGPTTKDGISYWCEKDPTLWGECMKERSDHDKLIKLCKPTKHYCGHMHMSSTNFFEGCYSRILDELEIILHDEYSI
jgi:Icc-related predicted phosphoesterase